MLTSKQQNTVASSTARLNAPGPAANPNEKITRTDIRFDNFFDQLVLPVISDSKAIESIRALLADPKKRAERFSSITAEASPQQLAQAEELLKQLELSKKITLSQDNLNLIRSFYKIAFRPSGTPLMNEQNQTALRHSIDGAKLPPNIAAEWDIFKNSGPANRLPLRGFTEGTLIMFAISARCFAQN